MARKAPMAPMGKIAAIVVVVLVTLAYTYWSSLAVGIIAAIQGFDQEFIYSPEFTPYLYAYSGASCLVLLAILAPLYWRYFSINRSAQGMKTLLRHWTRPRQLLLLVMLAALIWAFCECISVAEMALFPGIQDAYNQAFGDDMPWYYVVFYVCIFGPISEELAFRGIAQHALQRARMPLWLVLALPAAGFAFMHHIPFQMVYAFFMGLVAGWICYRTKSVLPGIAIHIMNNSFSCIFSVHPGESNPVYYMALAVTAAVGVACVVMLAKKRLTLEPAPTQEVQAIQSQAAGE